MHLTGLDLLFWAATFLGHLILLFVLWTRNRIRSFPFFTTLIGMSIARTVTLFLIHGYGTKAQYFYTFWSLAVLDVGLQLCVAYELASHVFQHRHQWRSAARRQLLWWTVGSIVIATAVTWTAAPQTTMRIQTVLIKGNFFSAALMSELFVGIVAMSVAARLPWGIHATRIAQGLGIYSMATLGLETARTFFGLKHGSHLYRDLSHLRIAIYLACLLYWVVTLSRRPSAREMPESMRRQLSELSFDASQRAHMLQSWRQP